MTARHRVLCACAVAVLVVCAPPVWAEGFTGSDAALAHIADVVAQNYWRPIPRDSALAAIRAGGLEALDPYSKLFEPDEWAYMQSNVKGTFGGIGMVMEADSTTGEIRVTDTFARSPAAAAGIVPGAVVLAVDGRPVTGRSVDNAVMLVRGPVDSVVHLDLRLPRESAPRRLAIRRTTIVTESVHGASRRAGGEWSYVLDEAPDIAYLRIPYFTATTVGEVDRALAAIAHTRARGLILDLRDGSGGLFSAAVGVADRFLDSGVIVSQCTRAQCDTTKAEPGVGTTLPVALLVNAQTASASEVLTSALQDQHRATVIGSRTYGKGMVQRLFPLADSVSGFKITTGSYTRPSGRPIERHLAGSDSTIGGVWPDSGMSIALTPEQSAAVSETLASADGLVGRSHATIASPSRATDVELRRACDVLRARR